MDTPSNETLSPRPVEISPTIAVEDFSDASSASSIDSRDEVWRGLEGEIHKRLRLPPGRRMDECPVPITNKMLAHCREYFLRAQGETKLWKVIIEASVAQRTLLGYREKMKHDAPGTRLPPLYIDIEAEYRERQRRDFAIANRHADERALCALAKKFKSLADKIEEAHPDQTHEFLSYISQKDRGPEADEMLFKAVRSPSLESISRQRRDALEPQVADWRTYLERFDKRQRHLMRDFLEKASRVLKTLDDLRNGEPGDKEFRGYVDYGPVGDLPLHLIYLHGVSVLCWDIVESVYVQRAAISLPYRSDLRWALKRCKPRDVEALQSRWVREGWVGPHMTDSTMGMFTGETVLHIAIAQQEEEVVEQLLESKADVRALANGLFFAPSRIVPYHGSLDFHHYLFHYNQIGKRWGRVVMPLISTQWSRRKSSAGTLCLPLRRYYYWELRENASLMHTWWGGSSLINNEDSGWYGGELPLSFAASVGNTAIMWHIVSHVKSEIYQRWRAGIPAAAGQSPTMTDGDLSLIGRRRDTAQTSETNLTWRRDTAGSQELVAAGRYLAGGEEEVGNAKNPDAARRVSEERGGDGAIAMSSRPSDSGGFAAAVAGGGGAEAGEARAVSVRALRGGASSSPLAKAADARRGCGGGGVFSDDNNGEGEGKGAREGGAREGAESARRAWRGGPQTKSFMVRQGRSEAEWVDITRYHELQSEEVLAFINAQDSHGNTALHMAVYHNRQEAVDWIMENGGQRSFTILNHLGLTPFTLSAYLGNADMFLHILNTHMSEQMWTYGPVCSCKTNLALIDSFRVALPKETSSDLAKSRHYSLESTQVPREQTWTDCVADLHADRNYRSALEVVIEHRVQGIFASHRAITLLKRLVHKKWHKFGRRNHLLYRFVPYFAFAISFSVMISMRSLRLRTDAIADANELPRKITSNVVGLWVLEICLLVFGIPFLLRSAWVNKRVRVTDLDVNMDGVVDHQERVIFLFKNMSSALDVMSTALMILCGVLRILDWQNQEVQVLSVATIIVWSNVLSTFMPFEYVGSLVITIHEMLVGDVTKFILIYLVLVLGFGQAFYLLLQGGEFSEDMELQQEVQCVDCDQHLGKMLLKLMWVSLGESDQMALIETMSAPNLAVGIYIVYVILSLLLLLNLIIAMMGDTFNRQITEIEKHWFYPYAEMVLRYEKKLSRREQLRCRIGIQAHRDEDEQGAEASSALRDAMNIFGAQDEQDLPPAMAWMYQQFSQDTDHPDIRL